MHRHLHLMQPRAERADKELKAAVRLFAKSGEPKQNCFRINKVKTTGSTGGLHIPQKGKLPANPLTGIAFTIASYRTALL